MIGPAQISQELQKHRYGKSLENLMCKMSFCEILHLFSRAPITIFFGVITGN